MTEEQNTTARSRLASIGWRSAAIAAAAAVTGIAALVVLADPAPQAPRYKVGENQDGPAPVTADPLRAELARCRSLPADTDDAACRAAWEVNRRRFMGESRSLMVRPDILPVPAASAVPADAQAEER